jgi:beta-1,4-mannosyl-glycoprotein beta-1,4-N-acetylglucosaminyltransferase
VQPEELREFNVVYVSMKDLPELLGRTEFHTVICSRYISFLELYGNACSFYQFYIWAHDTRLLSYGCNLGDGAIIRKWAECIDGCVCQTQWHADQYIQLYPELKPKMTTINNGIDLELFQLSASNPKQADKFVYTSRTERGLARVLDLWPEVVAALPHATLVVSTYEAFPCNDDERRIEARIESLNREFPDNRIQHVGKLNPTQLYAEMSTAEYWLYPTNWPETSCITAMEMLMSGVICFYYPMAGLTDTMNGCGVQISPGTEIQTLREIAHDEEKKCMLRKEGRAYAESCSWATRANAWKQTIFGKRVAIFNSFPFHYELFGHILSHFSRKAQDGALSAVSIFTETKNNLGWLDFYKTQFNHLNVEFRPISDFCDVRHEFDLIFVPTDDDFAFKREWIDDRCIVTDNHVLNRRPEYKHHVGLRPFAGNDKRWALPCYDLVSASDKMTHLEPDCIHVAISVGWKIVLNYCAINRLSARLPLHIHFIGRKFDDIASKMNADANIEIHLHEQMDTRDMIELLRKCDYVMTDLQNDDHINGISMSGVVPLAFSTLTPLIISKQNNRFYGFKNVVEFELNADADDRIVLSKRDDNDIAQLKVERDGLIAMYDGAIDAISAANVASKTKKIVDCFIFYNELEMLSYRLHTLNSVVDYFVIVEARQTHVGASKPLHFEENKHDPRFLPYADKIIHIVVDLPHTQAAMNVDISQNHQWTNENFQRNCISRGIDELASRLNHYDIIVVADLDEVPDPATLAKMKESCFSLNKVVAFEQDFYYYNLKCKHTEKWNKCKALTFGTYKVMNVSFETIRHLRCEPVANGGWHLSYFGDAKFIKNKIENFTHQEHNLEHITDVDAIQKRIDEGIDLYMRPGETFERIAICDNEYLPPFYKTHLTAFYAPDAEPVREKKLLQVLTHDYHDSAWKGHF